MIGSSERKSEITSEFSGLNEHIFHFRCISQTNLSRFHAFFHHVDHFKTDYFLWVTASGLSAAKQSKAPGRTDNNSDDEADVNGEEV